MRRFLAGLLALCLIGSATPAWGALGTPTLIGETSQTGGAAATITLTTTAIVPANAVVVVTASGFTENISANAGTITDSAGNSYPAANNAMTTVGSVFAKSYCAVITTQIANGGTITATFQGAAGGKALSAAYVTGGTCGTADKQTQTSATALSAPTATTPASGSVVMAVLAANTPTATYSSEAAGFTNIGAGLTTGTRPRNRISWAVSSGANVTWSITASPALDASSGYQVIDDAGGGGGTPNAKSRCTLMGVC